MRPARPHWRPAYVGIGSNLNDPRRQVRSALNALANLSSSRLVSSSRLYRSKPLDGTDQPDYLNAVAALLTQRDALTFLHELQSIEKQHGRERSAVRWAPRSLDLDLLVFGELEICNDELIVPHPGMAERSFVLLPLCEIAPHLKVPGRATVREMLQQLRADGSVMAVAVEQ